MINLKVETYLKLVLAICFISIISAYFIEYVLGHQPCNLCIIERIPYGLGIILIFINLVFKKNEKFLIILLILIFIFSLLISFYHFGIEQSFFKESTVCSIGGATDIISKEELIKQLNEKNISCKDVTFKIFGLSLTSVNIIISFIIIILLFKIYRNHGKVR
mgnify:CR=1 FL=1|tara:strand:+ start:607 stop:1092 length:486 start_codon:yes stop_codon:yes gene_type:complete